MYYVMLKKRNIVRARLLLLLLSLCLVFTLWALWLVIKPQVQAYRLFIANGDVVTIVPQQIVEANRGQNIDDKR